MATVKPLDASTREKLAAMLQGDSKPGSIRSHLARGIAGSPVDDSDTGLLSMTPLGPIMDMYDARNGKGGPGKMVSAAAGMIPGEGSMANMVEGLAERPISQSFLQDVADHHAEIAESEREHAQYSDDGADYFASAKALARKFGNWAKTGNVEAAAKFLNTPGALVDNFASDGISSKLAGFPANELSEKLDNPAEFDLMGDLKHKAVPVRNNPIADPGAEAAPSTGVVGAERQMNPELFSQAEEDDHLARGEAAEAVQKAIGEHINAGATDLLHDLEPNEQAAVVKAAAGDPHKANFIANAMMDEGGNVPEEVADTLMDHADEHSELEDMMQEYEVPNRDALGKELVYRHSIPEMLGMHYDLNPSLMSKAYSMDDNPVFEVTQQDIRDGNEPWQGAQPGHYRGQADGDSDGPFPTREAALKGDKAPAAKVTPKKSRPTQ